MKRHLLLFAMLLLISASGWSQVIVVDTTAIDFQYNHDQTTGPSDTIQFSISAEGLEENGKLLVYFSNSLQTAFEFSLNENDDNFESDTIFINYDSHGIVDDTTIYVRMKEGLEVGVYDDTIRIEYDTEYDTLVFHKACHGIVMGQVAKPQFTLSAGTYQGRQTVEITCDTDDAIIRYTTDGSDPDENSQLYNGAPITIEKTTILQAIGIKEGEEWIDSEIAYAMYQIQYHIKASVFPENSGEIEFSNCIDTWVDSGNHIYTLHARPNINYSFMNWKENEDIVSENMDFSFLINRDYDLIANFKINDGNIQTHVIPDSAGYVSIEGSYEIGNTIILQAFPYNNCFEFSHWNDDSDQNPHSVIVEPNTNYTAYFNPKTFTIIAQSDNENWGRVTGGGNSFICQEVATLEAIPEEGYAFIKWNDDNTDNPRNVTVSEDLTFTAFFVEIRFAINVLVDPENAGRVLGGGNYHYWDTCTVTAQANPGYKFINWTENNHEVSRQDNYTFDVREFFNLNNSCTLIAHFEQIPIVSTIETPETICDNDSLDLVTPEYSNADSGEWQLSPDTTFVNAITYQGERLGQSYNGWYLRYTVNNELDTVSSNVVTITVQSFIDENEIDDIYAKGPEGRKYMLIYPSPRDGFHYQWYQDNNLIQGATGQYFYKQGGLDNGDYKVYISFNDDVICGAFSTVIEVNNTNANLSRLFVYPNPSPTGTPLVIINDSEGDAQLSIYALDGKLLHCQTVTGVQATVGISLPQGIYVARLANGNDVKVEKIVIQ